MGNNWMEPKPNLIAHEFEIYVPRTSIKMDEFHWHNFYEIRFILRGHITHYNENSVAQLSDGAVSVMPPGLFHRTMYAVSADEPYSRVLLYVSTNLMHAIGDDSLDLADLYSRFGVQGKQHLHLPEDVIAGLAKPLNDIVAADDDDRHLRHFINRANVTLVLARLAELLEPSAQPYKGAAEPSLAPRAIAYINANLSENLSLDRLADIFFVNKFYLSHQFKQFTKLSPHQYILARRMMQAQIMLRSGASPSDVSRECGYHEYSSFYKAFLRATGLSPQAFRAR